MPEQYTQNQHQHPRVSLRHFADKPTRDGRVWVFDKQTLRSSHRGTNSIASEDFFYDFPEDEDLHPNRPQRVEKALGAYETFYGEFSPKLIRSLNDLRNTFPWNRRHAINDDDRMDLSRYLTMQYLRTNEFRASQRQVIENFSNFAIKTGAMIRKGMANKLGISEDVIPKTFKIGEEVWREDQLTYDPTRASAYQASMMFGKSTENIADHMFNYIWLFGFVTGEKTLYTSDSPVVKFAHYEHLPNFSGGFTTPSIEVDFPISPNYLLMMRGRGFHEYSIPLEDHVFPLSDENIRYYNQLQVGQSYRQVCCRDDDFDLARELCERNPQMRDPDKRRWAGTGVGKDAD